MDIPQRRPLVLGTTLPTNERLGPEFDEFIEIARRPPQLGAFFSGWPYATFDARLAGEVRARNAVPMVNWEPWDYRAPVTQTRYSMASIAAGEHDDYIRGFAEGVRRFGSTVFVRFAHEMNGNWYPWCVGVNGTTAEDYIAAWRRVVHLCREVGAHNARWVWCPNARLGSDQSTSPVGGAWPGAEHVDWVALDGYNGGAEVHWGGWLSPGQIFDASLAVLRNLAPNTPVMIAETACAELGGDKAAWMRWLFDWLTRHPEITALVWFNEVAHANWPVDSSASSREAFARSLEIFSVPDDLPG